jgi:hypothetical protein
MEVSYTSLPIANYVEGLQKNQIIVNRDYQRNDEVWPDPANSFLIETILLKYPMPKLSLRQLTDLQAKKVYKEIVDGQQRTRAIRNFYEGNLRLSKHLGTERLRAKTYDELEEEDKQRFLDYQLNIDLYLGTTAAQVREIFRRINSYTIPLNPEEQRHARFQGPMKWFVNSLSERYDETLAQLGVFTENQLIRMADGKLFAEVIHALENGITTTNAAQLTALYESFEVEFPKESVYDGYLTNAIDCLISWKELHKSALMRPYQVYALVLALIHLQNRLDVFLELFPLSRRRKIQDSTAIVNLSRLAAALEAAEPPPRFQPFIASSSEKTNVKKERETRFVWFCKALSEPSI